MYILLTCCIHDFFYFYTYNLAIDEFNISLYLYDHTLSYIYGVKSIPNFGIIHKKRKYLLVNTKAT